MSIPMVIVSGLPGEIATLGAEAVLLRYEFKLAHFGLTSDHSEHRKKEFHFPHPFDFKMDLILPSRRGVLANLVKGEREVIALDLFDKPDVEISRENMEYYIKEGWPFLLQAPPAECWDFIELAKNNNCLAVIDDEFVNETEVLDSLLVLHHLRSAHQLGVYNKLGRQQR